MSNATSHPVIFAILITIIAAGSASAVPTPSPTPFTISDSDLAKLTPADIAATVRHEHELNGQLLQINAKQRDELASVASSQTAALNASTSAIGQLASYAKQVTDLASHDATVTAQLNKAEKSLWWYRLHWWGAWIMLGLGVLACLVLAFLKFTGRLAILGTAVASKIP
jgi:hypothetical protein